MYTSPNENFCSDIEFTVCQKLWEVCSSATLMNKLPLLPAQVIGVQELTCIPCPLDQCCPFAHPNYSPMVKVSLSVL